MARISYIDNMESWQRSFRFFYPVTVRFGEIDMFGHLNNTVPIAYFEAARIEYFNDLGFMQRWVDSTNKTIIVAADIQCDYIKQVYYKEQLKIYVKPARLGNSSVDLHYMGKRENDEVVFTGRGTIVQISRSTGKAVAWSDEMREIYQAKEYIE